MSELTTTPDGNQISNVPYENVKNGKHYDGSVTPMQPQKSEFVREAGSAGGEFLSSPDGLFTISVECKDLELRLHLIHELRYFFNDPERAASAAPRVRNALEREEVANTTIPK